MLRCFLRKYLFLLLRVDNITVSPNAYPNNPIYFSNDCGINWQKSDINKTIKKCFAFYDSLVYVGTIVYIMLIQVEYRKA
jgi:hypothetical protein